MNLGNKKTMIIVGGLAAVAVLGLVAFFQLGRKQSAPEIASPTPPRTKAVPTSATTRQAPAPTRPGGPARPTAATPIPGQPAPTPAGPPPTQKAPAPAATPAAPSGHRYAGQEVELHPRRKW